MASYLIATLDISDEGAFREYQALVKPVISQYGGRTLVSSKAVDVREGKGCGRVVIVEFPTSDGADTFYRSAEYAPLIDMRVGCSTADLLIVPGLPQP